MMKRIAIGVGILAGVIIVALVAGVLYMRS